MAANACDCFFLLDEDDRILDWGGRSWDTFARDNGGEALAARDLTGDLIYDHVAGHFTKRFLRAFFAEARRAEAPVSRNYRCDSPRAKRLMEMRAEIVDAGALRIEHRLVSASPLSVEIEVREQSRGATHQRCSICNRLRASGLQDWREPELCKTGGGPVPVVHTVCADCRAGLAGRRPLRPPAS